MSKGEAGRYEELLQEEKDGLVTDLKLQVPYKLHCNGTFLCTYVADFVYQRDGATVTEDFKGVRTGVYKLKKKLMKICLGIDIFETGSPKRKRPQKPRTARVSAKATQNTPTPINARRKGK